MRYLLFDWNTVDEDIDDPDKLTDQEFEELAKLPNGFIFENSNDFQNAFGDMTFSTTAHELRIIDNITPELSKINTLICENEIGAWESDLEGTITAVILEDYQEVHDEEDLKERDDDGIVKYNGWGLKLLNLISKPK